MKKVFSSHASLAHVWANQLQNEGKASNMFFQGPVIYSYGYHYEIARFVEAPNGEKVVFFNSNGYSNSTAKHSRHVWNAIPDGIKVFSVPFVNNYFNSNMLSGIIDKMIIECKNLLFDQLKARTKFYLFSEASGKYESIKEICQLFNMPLPARPDNWEEARVKAEHLRNTEEQRVAEKERKELEKSMELLNKWLRHEFNGQLYNIPVHLRVSKDGRLVETTKGARVGIEAALRLLAKLRNNEDVKGEKIDGFTIIENNTEAVKIGCHVISWDVINQLF